MGAKRPALSWSGLRGTRAGVWGLGVEGRANLRKLATLGAEPVLVDDRPSGPGPDGRPVLATAEGGLDALAGCEVVVKSPGISRYRPEVTELTGRGIPVAGGLGLWLAEADRGRVACITGTKGKSSTTAVAGHLLRRWGYPCMVGGNIGQPPWDPAAGGQDARYWVIETSSYQATDLAVSPAVVAVTSLHPDHLDWHGDVETYYRDKLSACSQPGADLTVANGDSAELAERAAQLGPRVEWVRAGDDPGAGWMAPLRLLGAHSRRNALIARACLRALGVPEAGDPAALAAAAAGFVPLASRLQVIGEVGGVTFVDDSLSTNVLPTLAALDAFPGRRIALITGGHDRGIDYAPLATGLAARDMPTLVLAVPDSGPRIQAAVEAAEPAKVDVVACDGLDAAVERGFGWALPDGVVLLSPAAPSFGRFRDYADRAEAFARAMTACRG
ncbi:MAG TPA: UDP-N-acetylmuramoyl-L-alanine--D-glutamate ligase [Streptosporangiaceae bacterium]|jgi:UDP-N-acetylmuramoylalanine--D-glutamate ligase|nr:UDP-N-acetylmuramoyl-L-alanine--D-glutamate ligase [Streptosporangiaceae bacterium]